MTPALTIRERTGADLPAPAQVLRAVHEQDGYPSVWPADPPAFLTPPLLVGGWVVEDGSGVQGHVLLRGVSGEGPGWVKATGLATAEVLVLSRLFVAPETRGQGIGQALLQVAWSAARHHGRRAILDVHGRNHAAARLYDRGGWQRVATVNGDWRDPDGTVPRVHVDVAPLL